jgi:hypothetical protein
LKTAFTYLLIILFSFAFSYKTLKYVAKLKADICCTTEMDCENEKESTPEKDEITDDFYHFSFIHKDVLLTAETVIPSELIVNFTSANYSNSVYSPPENVCC